MAGTLTNSLENFASAFTEATTTKPITTRAHAVLDYTLGPALLLAPQALGFPSKGAAAAVPRDGGRRLHDQQHDAVRVRRLSRDSDADASVDRRRERGDDGRFAVAVRFRPLGPEEHVAAAPADGRLRGGDCRDDGQPLDPSSAGVAAAQCGTMFRAQAGDA